MGVNMKNDGCPICNAENCVEITKGLLLGKLTLKGVANHFNMSIQQVWEHITQHEIKVGDKKSNKLDLTEQLEMISRTLIDDYLLKITVGDYGSTREIKEIVSEIRQICKTIDDIKNKVATQSQSSTNINVMINNLQQQYQSQIDGLIELIMGDELCDKCREKIMKVMKLDEGEVIYGWRK